MRESTIIQFFSTPKASSLSSNFSHLTSVASTSKKRSRIKCVNTENSRCKQTILDLGQKRIGLENCLKVF